MKFEEYGQSSGETLPSKMENIRRLQRIAMASFHSGEDKENIPELSALKVRNKE